VQCEFGEFPDAVARGSVEPFIRLEGDGGALESEPVDETPGESFGLAESENLTQLVADHRWSAALSAVSKYWFTTLERVSWLIAIILGFLSPHMAKGHTRRVLMFFIAIILVNIVLISPVTQARLRFPAEPFIWSAAVAGYCLWRNRPSAGKVL
jgi:hypothetical protein